MHASIKNMALAIAFAGLSSAQTFSECNPVKGDKCTPNPAYGGESSINFLTSSKIDDIESFFKVDGGIKYDTKYDQLSFNKDTGMKMSIFEEKHAPTLYSNDFLFFGHVEVELRAAPGAGIITSVVLQSDTLDEIDWEWIGNDPANVQTNVFFQGIENYNFGGKHAVSDAMNTFHTYSIDWTPDRIAWSVDGKVVREHLPDTGVFPQTPCQLRIGTWVGGKGDPKTEQGRIDWAGGLAQWDKAPFNAYYRRIKVVDYAGGYDAATKYEYTNKEGTWESIKVHGGKKVGFPGESPPIKDNNEILESSSEIESSTAAPTTITTKKVTTTAAPTTTDEVSSAIETETSEISSDIPTETETSSVAVRTTVTTTAAASSSAVPAPSASQAPAEDDDTEEVPESAATALQRGSLFLGAALFAGALML